MKEEFEGWESPHIDYRQNEKSYHREIARLTVEYCDEKSEIIDIGCGMGYILRLLRESLPEARLSAADIDDKCLEITGERALLDEKILIKEIEDLFDRENRYDAVIMSHVLEHTLRPADTVQGIYKMVKPGGIMVLAVPNPVRPSVFLHALRKRHYVNRGHAYAWDRSHWMNFLENILGLDVVCYSQDFAWTPDSMIRVGEYLAKYFPWLCFSNIAVIRKRIE